MAQDPFDFDFSAPHGVSAPTLPPPDPAAAGYPPGPAYLPTGPQQKKKRTGLKIALIIVGLLVVLFVAFIGFGVWLVASHQSTAQEEIPVRCSGGGVHCRFL